MPLFKVLVYSNCYKYNDCFRIQIVKQASLGQHDVWMCSICSKVIEEPTNANHATSTHWMRKNFDWVDFQEVLIMNWGDFVTQLWVAKLFKARAVGIMHMMSSTSAWPVLEGCVFWLLGPFHIIAIGSSSGCIQSDLWLLFILVAELTSHWNLPTGYDAWTQCLAGVADGQSV